MGPQQVLRVAACLLLVGGVASARERVAVIDLGPDDGTRQKLAAAIVAGGLEPVIGEGVEDALAGINGERDSVALAAALAEAKDKFGALACPETIAAAQTAISIGAARQAAGLPVPELARAWTYVLLCADRMNDASAAFAAATAIRTLAGSISASTDVDAKLLAKYPDIDALSNRDVMEVEIKADVDGADLYLDFRPVGKSPIKLVMATGPHIIAAAAGSQRGTVTGTVIRKQPIVTIPMQDQSSKWSSLAMRVASWHGKVPRPKEIEWALGQVDARVALVRHGDTVEAWGHPGQGEPVRRLGGDDGSRKLDEAPALVALVVDRTQTWVDRAPDPDQPLLTETPEERKAHGNRKKGEEEEPTRWWVYATIAGAIVAGSIVIYAHNQADDTQRVELKYP